MSKLDKALEKIGPEDPYVALEGGAEAKQAIKDLMLELVGEDIPDTGNDDYTSDVWNERNKQLRKKIKAL